MKKWNGEKEIVEGLQKARQQLEEYKIQAHNAEPRPSKPGCIGQPICILETKMMRWKRWMKLCIRRCGG